jgi:hypothetical protein
MKQMSLQAKRATVGGARHPSLGGFLFYCMTGKIL